MAFYLLSRAYIHARKKALKVPQESLSIYLICLAPLGKKFSAGNFAIYVDQNSMQKKCTKYLEGTVYIHEVLLRKSWKMFHPDMVEELYRNKYHWKEFV